VAAGDGIASKPRGARRWIVTHAQCPGIDAYGEDSADRGERDAERRLQAHDDTEYARGQADYERWNFNRRVFGDDYANAEELAWELKDPDPAY
jgi:hypothetical protein